MTSSPSEVLAWLSRHLAGFDWTATATVVLAAFGGLQILLARRDYTERLRAAVAILRAEQSRLQRLAELWKQDNTIELASMGATGEADLQPPAWDSLMAAVGACGGSTAFIAGFAFGRINDAVMQVRQLNAQIEIWRHLKAGGQVAEGPAETAAWLEAWPTRARSIATAIQGRLDGAGDLMRSAILHAPKGSEPLRVDKKRLRGLAGAELFAELELGKSPSRWQRLTSRPRLWLLRSRLMLSRWRSRKSAEP